MPTLHFQSNTAVGAPENSHNRHRWAQCLFVANLTPSGSLCSAPGPRGHIGDWRRKRHICDRFSMQSAGGASLSLRLSQPPLSSSPQVGPLQGERDVGRKRTRPYTMAAAFDCARSKLHTVHAIPDVVSEALHRDARNPHTPSDYSALIPGARWTPHSTSQLCIPYLGPLLSVGFFDMQRTADSTAYRSFNRCTHMRGKARYGLRALGVLGCNQLRG